MADKVDLSAKKPQNKARTKTPKTEVDKTKTKNVAWWKVVLDILALLVWVGASVVVAQLVVGHLMIWILGAETFVQPVWTAVFSASSYLLALVLVILVPPKISVAFKLVNKHKDGKIKTINNKTTPKALGRTELGLRGWPTWTDIGLSLVGFIVYLMLAVGLTALFMFFPWFAEVADQSQDVGFNVLNSGLDRVVAFITLVVIAPIAEEIIFRGWLYRKLRIKLSEKTSNLTGMVITILLVSLLFGLIHMQWNVGVNVFALSVVLCGLREITGTIYAGILLHMLKNGIAFYMLYVLGIG